MADVRDTRTRGTPSPEIGVSSDMKRAAELRKLSDEHHQGLV
jgi:hypothetical protein